MSTVQKEYGQLDKYKEAVWNKLTGFLRLNGLKWQLCCNFDGGSVCSDRCGTEYIAYLNNSSKTLHSGDWS